MYIWIMSLVVHNIKPYKTHWIIQNCVLDFTDLTTRPPLTCAPRSRWGLFTVDGAAALKMNQLEISPKLVENCWNSLVVWRSWWLWWLWWLYSRGIWDPWFCSLEPPQYCCEALGALHHCERKHYLCTMDSINKNQEKWWEVQLPTTLIVVNNYMDYWNLTYIHHIDVVIFRDIPIISSSYTLVLSSFGCIDSTFPQLNREPSGRRPSTKQQRLSWKMPLTCWCHGGIKNGHWDHWSWLDVAGGYPTWRWPCCQLIRFQNCQGRAMKTLSKGTALLQELGVVSVLILIDLDISWWFISKR